MMKTHKPYDLHASIGFQATLSARTFERRLEDGLKTIGLTRMQWCVLLAVGGENHNRPSQIAEFIGIDRTATSRALRSLEAEELIERTPDRKDRRVTQVVLTEAGHEKLDQALPIAAENNGYFSDKLNPDELASLHRLLLKLRAGEHNEISNF
jgi:DNA-binding MarR family transcriptional regulator